MYQLVKLKNGKSSIHARVEGETFHPVIGPEAEARALYVDQLKFRQRLGDSQEPFVVWDVGLGGGANAVTLLKSIRDLSGRLALHSFDRTTKPLEFALQNAVELGYFDPFEAHAQELLRNKTVDFRDNNLSVRWRLHVGDFPSLLKSGDVESLPKPHAILFDAFSPAKNPDMWTFPLFKRLYDVLDPSKPCSMSTYSRSTMLRVAWLLAGFYVGIGSATGEKEQTTIASNHLTLIDQPLGLDWLDRAYRSTSAEPLPTAFYRQSPLTETTRLALASHPQFVR